MELSRGRPEAGGQRPGAWSLEAGGQRPVPRRQTSGLRTLASGLQVTKGMIPAAVVALAACGGAVVNGQWAAPRAEVIFPDNTRVKVEVARTDPERNRGLMFRKELAPDAGMIFLFDRPGFYPFWMANCFISLDIIWLDKDARIVSMAESVPPCRLPDCNPPCYSPSCPNYAPKEGTEALYVVEVVPGFAKQHKLKVGDRVEFKGIDRKTM